MSDVIVLIGSAAIGLAIARRISPGKRVLLPDVSQENANAAATTLGDTPESSEFTSAKCRIDAVKEDSSPVTPNQSKPLFPFIGYSREIMPVGLPFRLQDYLELLDWTGRQLRKGKRGIIDDNQPHILDRLNIDANKWLYTTSHFEHSFQGIVGTVQSLVRACRKLGYQRTPGRSSAQLLT